jgi:transcriptional repressor NrdR
MICPYCGASKSGVVDSRDADDGQAVRRRRSCHACQRRFTTYERVEEMPLLVIKKDGRRQTFDRNKLIRGMRVACEKLRVPLSAIEEAAASIERRAWDVGEREIAAQWFGEQVQAELRQLSEVAYVRFTCVYRSFRDVDEFVRELQSMKEGALKEPARPADAPRGHA